MIIDYHKGRKAFDCNYTLAVFDADDKVRLDAAVAANPKAIVRLRDADLVAAGMRGYGGFVPSGWNGLVIKGA